MIDQATENLVEMAFLPLDEVIERLTKCGVEVLLRESHTVMVRNLRLDIWTAIDTQTDPNTRAVCLGFLFAGMHWPWVFPELQLRVNAEWKKRSGRK